MHSQDSSDGDTPVSCSASTTNFTNNMNASIVLGQADFTSGSSNSGGSTSASSMDTPLGISVYNNALYISDTGNNRVLIHNSMPTSNNPNANIVLGHTDFTSSTGGTSSTKLSGVQDIIVGSDWLAVTEWNNSRISFFPTSTLATGAAASLALGQPDLTSNTSNNGGIGANTINTSTSVTRAGDKFIVTDASNHRVLVYDANSLANGLSASVVIGQPNMTSNSSGTATNQLDFPLGVASDGTNLIIVDAYNNRVLIYNSIPTTNGASADVVLGGIGTAADKMNNPVGAFYDGDKLFVADRSNHRSPYLELFTYC